MKQEKNQPLGQNLQTPGENERILPAGVFHSVLRWVNRKYVWAGLPNLSKASLASARELAVVALMYSRKIGNVFHKAYALKARMISTPAVSATCLIKDRFLRSNRSSNKYIGLFIFLNPSISTFIICFYFLWYNIILLWYLQKQNSPIPWACICARPICSCRKWQNSPAT